MDASVTGTTPGAADLSAHLTRGLVGHEKLIERLLTALLAGGHVLIEGAPGLAKTRAVKWLASALDGSFSRIQCTPDLMPADVTGTPVFRPDSGAFAFTPGPVFHNLVLVDEVNRAPPKVQSALLEAMAEHQVTTGSETHALPQPFMVVATQNPIEHEGTFPLPEAQLDRFLLHVILDLPGPETELQILNLVLEEGDATAPVQITSLQDLAAMRQSVSAVHLAPELKDYIVRLVTSTRTGSVSQHVDHPVSPRGSLALAMAARARAYLHGRDHALPQDVAALAEDALAHRMVLSWKSVAEGHTARGLIADLLNEVEPL
ncbi:MAG: AAA family ATPase [Pseudomonadota bacterium]